MERKREDNVHWGMENARGKGKGMDSNIYCTYQRSAVDLADATYILHRGQYRRRETGRSRTNGGRAKWSWHACHQACTPWICSDGDRKGDEAERALGFRPRSKASLVAGAEG